MDREEFDPERIPYFRHAADSPLTSEVEDTARQIIACAIEVHRVLGPGYLEELYEEALCIELESRRFAVQRQVPIQINYKGRLIGRNKVDLIVNGLVLVELKAVEAFAPVHTAQVISYLKTTRLRLGLLMNFNVALLRDGLKRIVH